MSRKSFVWAGALALTLGGCAAGVQLARSGMTDPGELLFNGYAKADVGCYACHNGDATGTWRGPSLADKAPKMSDAAIIEVIEKGPGFMPAFKGKLTAEEEAQIVGWLRSRFGASDQAAPVDLDDAVEPEPAPAPTGH